MTVTDTRLAATRELSDAAASKLSNDELAALWRAAEAKEPAALRDSPPEPDLQLHLDPALTLDIIDRPRRERAVDRFDVEAHTGRVLVERASPAQTALLERLVRATGPAGSPSSWPPRAHPESGFDLRRRDRRSRRARSAALPRGRRHAHRRDRRASAGASS